MNPYKNFLLLLALGFCSIASAQTEPTRIRIGETIITLQSPLRLQSSDQDTLETTISFFTLKSNPPAPAKKYPRFSNGSYIGFGFAVPTREESYLPIHAGNSFNLEVGWRYVYHPSKYYAIGTFLQYGCYSYRMKEAAEMFTGNVPQGDVSKEFFRTDNIGTGLIQRVRLLHHTQLEAIVYGDWAYSKRYVVKSRVNGHKEKSKYRDDIKFNPFGAGAQVGIRWSNNTLYARYRLTNFFNPDYIPAEVPRLSFGISFGL